MPKTSEKKMTEAIRGKKRWSHDVKVKAAQEWLLGEKRGGGGFCTKKNPLRATAKDHSEKKGIQTDQPKAALLRRVGGKGSRLFAGTAEKSKKSSAGEALRKKKNTNLHWVQLL